MVIGEFKSVPHWVTDTFDLATWEAEAGESLSLRPAWSGLHSERVIEGGEVQEKGRGHLSS